MKQSVIVAVLAAVVGAMGMNVVVDAQQAGVSQNLNIVTGSTDQFIGDMFRQRQNEAVLGISSLNPLHQMAAYNDYRTVDLADDPSSIVPPSPIGIFARLLNLFKAPWLRARGGERDRDREEGAEGDSAQAWIGLSFTDNGKDWYTGLHPGHPFDFSNLAPVLRNPNGGYQAASDPVMATTADKFFVGGVAFTPGPNGQSVGFVSRFVDRNDTEVGRNIHYEWTKALVVAPTGFFVDKPNIAAGPDGHVYVAFVVFDQNDPQRLSSKIYFYRSTDYGVTWSTTPVILSDPLTRNQSPWILVDPNNENIVYVGWRVFANRSGGIANAIVGRKSTNGGASFIPALPYIVAAQLKAFDQPQGVLPQSLPIPRSNAYPTAAIDGNGALHAAIQEYVNANGAPLGPSAPTSNGVPRITVTSSYDGGVTWTARRAVDHAAGAGTQFMPVLTAVGEPGNSCAGNTGPRSRIMLMYYDARASNVGTSAGTTGYVIGGDKQFDVRITTAPACPRDSNNRLVFSPSVQMSRYSLTAEAPHGVQKTAGFGHTAVNRGYSMFCGGNCSFTGDYIHVVPRVPYVLTPSGWRPTTARAVDKAKLPAPVVQGVWADARDVKMPTNPAPLAAPGDPVFVDSLPWWNYQAPGTGKLPSACENAGARDQNIYTAEFAAGELFAAAPETFRQSNIPHAYPLYIENRAAQQRLFRLTIDPTSFAAFNYTAFRTNPAPEPLVRTADVVIGAYSSVTGSVVIGPGVSAPVVVAITQVDGRGIPIAGGAKTVVTFNTAGASAASATETHTPSVSETPIVTEPFAGRTFPISATTPFTQTPFTQTPFTQTPFTQTPFTQNPFTQTPFTQTTTIFDVKDISFLVSNGGENTAAFSSLLNVANAEAFRQTNSYLFQVFINRLTPVPLLNGCQSGDGVQNVQISTILAPFTQTPFTQTPFTQTPFTQTPFTQTPFTQTPFTQTPFTQTTDPRDPVVSNSTFYVAPPSPVEQTARLQPIQPGARIVNASTAAGGDQAAIRTIATQAPSTLNDFRASRPTDLIMYTLRAYQIKPFDPDPAKFTPLFAANGQPLVGLTVKTDTPNIIVVNGQSVFDPAGPPSVSGGATVPVKLGFVTQPPAATAPGAPFSVQVAVQDGFGNPLATSTLPVTIGLGSSPGGGTLAGTLTRNAVGGIATFNNLSVSTAGTGYTLVATSGHLVPATSTPFAVANALVVTNTADSGPGSLRQVITAANAMPPGTAPLITFNIPGSGVHTITPATALPTLANAMTIDGTSQPGWAPGAPVIELNGTNAPLGTNGLYVTGSFVIIRGLVINRFKGEGIRFDKPATDGIVQGNFIGTNATGTEALGNWNSGVYIRRTGGISVLDNLISGNFGLAGVAICSRPSFCGGGVDIGSALDGRGNIIRGNRIGTNAAGTDAVPNNGYGINIDGAPETVVGGNSTGQGNVIAGNDGDGILISGEPGADGNLIKGNNIGIGAGGTIPIPNGLPFAAYGVFIATGVGNVIGGEAPGDGNVIAANLYGNIGLSGASVVGTIIQGNHIGVNAAGDAGYEEQSFGIAIAESTGTTIGHALTGEAGGNVISSTEKGIQLLGTAETGIRGNYIGTSADGAAAIGNGVGIFIEGASTTMIGGSSAHTNVISGNITGIHVLAAAGETATLNRILSNFIGTTADGAAPLPNTEGILLQANPPNDNPGGVLRGSVIDSNRIAYNHVGGITIAGAGATGNPIYNNVIFGTGTLCTEGCGTPLGIDLSASSVSRDGVTPNDAGDTDSGGNNLQNFPVITTASPTAIAGSLSSAPGTYDIQVFSNATCNASGFGEGQTLITSFTVNTDVTGNATFSQAVSLAAGQYVSATATRLGEAELDAHTSEFSACKLVEVIATPTALAITVAPTPTQAGSPITPAIQVAVRDALGNTVTESTAPITMSIGSNPAGGTLSGTLTRNAVNGIATFDDLSINNAGTGYSLVASSPGLTPSTSASFNVLAATADRLAFVVQPSAAMAGATIAPPVRVAIQDAVGNTVTTATQAVTLSINNPFPFLFGTTTQNAVNGIATFSDLAVDRPGSYELMATSGSLNSARSLAFTIEPSVFTVTSTGDSGTGSLRQAILDANGRAPGVTSTIRFNFTGTAPHTIAPLSALPGIDQSMVIDGTSGGVCAGVPPSIEIAGAQAGLAAHGLLVNSPGVVIRGLSITRFAQSGIFLAGGGNNVVECNWLGLGPDGTAQGNQDGIRISGSSQNVVGGTLAAARNVISGNAQHGVNIAAGSFNEVRGNYIGTNRGGDAAVPNATGVVVNAASARIADNVISGNTTIGIDIRASGATVAGNRVGTDSSGTLAVPNAEGVRIGNAPGNTIGGRVAGSGNLISGNTSNGVTIIGAQATSNLVEGNFIGTTANGLSALANGVGVEIALALNNRVGGTAAGSRNIISGNTSVGVEVQGEGATGNVVEGNYIGVNAAGAALGNGQVGVQILDASANTIGGASAAAGNTIAFNGMTGVGLSPVAGTPVNNSILSNSIHSNVGWGIDLGGIIPSNDSGDADTGVNGLQNYPVVVSASETSVTASLMSAPNRAYIVQFFTNTVCDASGFGEGQTFLDSFPVNTDAGGNASFTRAGFALTPGHMVTATATDDLGNTSAFSACSQVSPFVALTPNPLNTVTNATEPLTVTLSHPAGAGGQTVNLSSNNAVAAVQPTIVIAPGASTGTATVTTASGTGPAVITATAAGFDDGTANVNVSLRTMTLSAPSSLVGVGRSLTGTITLAQPAPSGGLAVNLVSSNSSFVTVSPANVTIAQGNTTGSFTINGIASGSSTITATATGASAATLTMTATTSSLISMGNPPVIAPGQTSGVAVSLGIDAPAGGVTITFVSSDTNVATITPSVFIPAGLRIPSANPQITGVVPGTASITASAPGFAPDTRTANITLTLTFTPATSFAVIAGRTSNITLNLSSPAPAGGLTFNTSIDNTALATVPPTIFIGAGLTSIPVPVTGVAVGNTTIRASGTGIAQASAPVRVDPTPPINISNLTVGRDLQAQLFGTLGLAAPAGGVVVTITSLDASRVLLSTSETAPGSASITVTVNAGSVSMGGFWVQALQGIGTSLIEATAPGYATDQSTITLTPSGFILNANSFTTNTRAANTSVRVDAVQLTPALAWSQTQDLRAGSAPVDVTVTSSNTSVGTIVGSPARFTGGVGFVNLAFDAIAPGSSTISVTRPAGFSVPSTNQSIVATVTLPSITIANPTVGKDLQESMVGSLGAPAPAGNLDVTITSSDTSRLLLTTNGTAVGVGSITITVNAGSSTIGPFFVQALAGSGTVNFTTSAPGYDTDTSTVTLTPSGFVLNMSNISTNTFAGNTLIRVDAAQLSTALAWVSSQPLRGGVSADVLVSSSNTTAGTIVGGTVVGTDHFARFAGGDQFDQTTSFDPAEAGSSTISLTTPAGFSTPNSNQSIVATVTAPAISIGTATIGLDLQTSVFISLGATPPSARTVTVTSNNAGIATIGTNGAVEGGTTVTFTNVTTTSVGSIVVQGRALGATTLTVTATGYSNGTSNVTVQPSGFVLNMSNITTNTFQPNTAIRVDAARLHPTSFAWLESQELRGGLANVNVPVVSSDTNVGEILPLGTPASFASGDLFDQSLAFHPKTAGTTTISITQPEGFRAASSNQWVVATVTAPAITIGQATVGLDLQTSVNISLAATPPSPVTVTVTSNNVGVATITTNGAVAGGGSVTFTNVTTTNVGSVIVQGRTRGSTTLTVQAAGYSDGTGNVRVDPSGFVLNMNNITTNTFAANTAIRVDAARLDPTFLNWSTSQELRGGISPVDVRVSSSNSAVGTIDGGVVVGADHFARFVGGAQFNQATSFNPASAGSATISLTPPPGFSIPSSDQSITATVSAPTITVGNATVGRDLQMSVSVFLQAAPPSPVTVTVTSNEIGIATITTNGAVAGGDTVTFTNVTSTNVGTFFVQGRGVGPTTLTTQAAGYATDTSTVTVDPSGFVLNMSNITTTAGAANTVLRIDAARLNLTTLDLAESQQLRGGLTPPSVSVAVSSSNPAVGTIDGSPVAFNSGDMFKQTSSFNPAATGTTTISLATPAGFSTPSTSSRSITATVNP